MLGQPRTTQRRARKVASDEGALRGDIVRLASRFGRYGYRRVTDMLRIEGWGVKHKRVERIWRQEGLKVPQRQPKRGRAVAQRRIVHPAEAAVSGPRLVVRHGPPEYLRSDNGPEFTAKLVRRWLGRVGVETLFIEPGSPWENGYNESFNGTLRNELLRREIFYAIPSYGLSGLITFGTIVSPQSSESAWGDFSMPGAHRPKRDSIGRM